MSTRVQTPPAPPARRPVPAPREIGLLVESRYRTQRQPARLVHWLCSQGHRIRDIDAEAVRIGDDGWCRGLDVLLCRGRSPGVLAVLGAAEAAGVRCVNRPAAIAAVVNKASMGMRLASAGVPVPQTYLGSVERIAEVATDRFPLILKPTCGDNANGLRIVWSRRELLELLWPEPLILAQQFHPGSTGDVKVYVAGRRVWAVRRPSPIEQTHGGRADVDSPGVPVAVTDEVRKLASRCGDVFGLDLYGIDCLETETGLIVLEVNDFPNYSGLADVDAALADLLLAVIEP
jgi:ribosomal protein S6--L-glutamate ligase